MVVWYGLMGYIYIYIYLVGGFSPYPKNDGLSNSWEQRTSQLFLESHKTCSSHHQPAIPSSLSLQICFAHLVETAEENAIFRIMARRFTYPDQTWQLKSHREMVEIFQPRIPEGHYAHLSYNSFFSRPLCGHVLSTLQPLRHKGRFLSFNMHGKNVADLGPFQLACKHEKKVVPMVLN